MAGAIGDRSLLGWTAILSSARRVCLFCGSTRELTREHVWPRWLASVLAGTGVPPTHVYFEEGATRREFRAPDYSIEVRAVCRRCNEGWMSKLEEGAKPILTPMITASSPTALEAAAQQLIVAWGVKTGMMVEQTQTGFASIPAAHHRFVGSRSVAPPRVQAWVGARASGVGLMRYDHQVIGTSPEGDRDGYGIMVGVGGMFLFVLSLPSLDGGQLAKPEFLLDPTDELAHAMARLAPLKLDPVSFPASQPLHDVDLDDLFAGLTGRGDLPLAERLKREAQIRLADRLWGA